VFSALGHLSLTESPDRVMYVSTVSSYVYNAEFQLTTSHQYHLASRLWEWSAETVNCSSAMGLSI